VTQAVWAGLGKTERDDTPSCHSTDTQRRNVAGQDDTTGGQELPT